MSSNCGSFLASICRCDVLKKVKQRNWLNQRQPKCMALFLNGKLHWAIALSSPAFVLNRWANESMKNQWLLDFWGRKRIWMKFTCHQSTWERPPFILIPFRFHSWACDFSSCLFSLFFEKKFAFNQMCFAWALLSLIQRENWGNVWAVWRINQLGKIFLLWWWFSGGDLNGGRRGQGPVSSSCQRQNRFKFFCVVGQ